MRTALRRVGGLAPLVPYVLALGALALWAGLEGHRALPGHHDPAVITAALTGSEPVQLAALASGTLMAMGPCVLQMGMVLTAFWSGVPPSHMPAQAAGRRWQLLKPAMGFLLGYLLLFGLLAGLIIATGHRLPEIWVRLAAGGVLAVMGMRLLLARRSGHTCGGAGEFLIRHGRRHPAAMGSAYAIYCAACCGPYLAGLSLVLAVPGAGAAGGLPSILAAALLLGLVMAAPILLPLVSGTATVQQWLARHHRPLALAAGLFLVGVGLLLVMGARMPGGALIPPDGMVPHNH